MSNIDKQALREAAEKAQAARARLESIPDEDVVLFEENDIKSDVSVCNKFIVTANPTTVLALLDELEHYKSREERVTKLVLDNSTSWDVLYKKLEAAEKRIAEQREYYEGVIADGSKRIAELEKGHQEAAKQINSWRRLAKQNIAERGKDISELEAARQRIAELEDAQCQHESDTLMLCHQFDELASAMGWTSELAMKQGVGQLEYARSIKARIAELEAKLETADKLQDSAFRDGLKAGFSYGQTDDQSGFAQCMSVYSTRAGIKVKGE